MRRIEIHVPRQSYLAQSTMRSSFYRCHLCLLSRFEPRPLLSVLFLFGQESPAIHQQTRGGQHTQTRGERLAGLDGTGHAGTGQDHRGEQGEFDTIGLSLRDSVTAQAVLRLGQLQGSSLFRENWLGRPKVNADSDVPGVRRSSRRRCWAQNLCEHSL